MNSSIFSSKAVIATGYAGLLFFCVSLAGIYFDDYHFIRAEAAPVFSAKTGNALKKGNPELVLIGSSYLEANIDEALLQGELRRLMGRPVRVAYLPYPANPMGTIYLVLKNHVRGNIASSAAVGVVYAGEDLISGELFEDNPAVRRTIFKNLKKDDAEFLSRTKGSFADNKAASAVDIFKARASRRFLEAALRFLHPWKDSRFNPLQILNARLNYEQLGGELETNGARRADGADSQENADFTRRLNGGFLPLIIEKMSGSSLFLIESHLRPSKGNEEEERLRESIRTYLKDKGRPLLSLQDERKLDDPRYYGQGHHLTKEGRDIATRALAQKIHQANLIKQ